MSIDKDPEFYKLIMAIAGGLLGIIGILLIAIGSFVIKMILGIKKIIEDKIFHRLNSTDHEVTKMKATCEERHRHEKN